MLEAAIYKVKPGQEGRLRRWLKELNRRRDEALETFARETMRHEVAYLLDGPDGKVLISAMEVGDPDRARKAYHSSSLPIDLEHREVMTDVLGEKAAAERLYDVRVPPDESDGPGRDLSGSSHGSSSTP
jgi:hypothetical protein